MHQNVFLLCSVLFFYLAFDFRLYRSSFLSFFFSFSFFSLWHKCCHIKLLKILNVKSLSWRGKLRNQRLLLNELVPSVSKEVADLQLRILLRDAVYDARYVNFLLFARMLSVFFYLATLLNR